MNARWVLAGILLVPMALGMFDDGLDPGYYENPSALTYLLFLVYAVGRCASSATPRSSPAASSSP